MWATALCNCLFSVEGIAYYKIPKNIWQNFFLFQKIEILWWRWFFNCVDVEFVKCFTPVSRKRVNRDVLRMEDVLPIYFEEIVNFCSNIYSIKYKLTQPILWKLYSEFGKFHQKDTFLRWFLTIFPESKNILHKCYLWQIPRLYLCKQEAEMVGWIRKVVFFDNSGDKALLAKIIIPQGKYLFRANPEYIYNFLQLCRRNFEKLCFIHIIDFHRLFFTKPLHTKGFW